MGTVQSTPIDKQSVSHLFAQSCAKQLTGIELWSFKENLQHELKSKSAVSLESFCKLGSIPDYIGPLLYKSCVFMGRFPFLADTSANCQLTPESLLKAVVFHTGRYKSILHDYDVLRLLFLSIAEAHEVANKEAVHDTVTYAPDEIDPWASFEVVKSLDKINVDSYFVPIRSIHMLFTYVLWVAATSHITEDTDKPPLTDFEKAASYMLNALCYEKCDDEINKINYTVFESVFRYIFPYVFVPLSAVFERYLYSDNTGGALARRQSILGDQALDDADQNTTSNGKETAVIRSAITHSFLQRVPTSNILTLPKVAQLSSLLGPVNVFGRLRMLYAGSKDGFSMRSFETKVLKWGAPTILLVKGSILPEKPQNSREKAFEELITPVRRVKSHYSEGTSVVYGAYVHAPWRSNAKQCFGDSRSKLFQLEPRQDLFLPSTIQKNYAYFCTMEPGGMGFGSPAPLAPGSPRKKLVPSNVSLTLESSLEFGIFRHVGGGGSYLVSEVSTALMYEARFEIDELEVWGLGDLADLEEQRKKWEWEEREAEHRRKINVGSYGEERALLELAGLVGNHGNGGSM